MLQPEPQTFTKSECDNVLQPEPQTFVKPECDNVLQPKQRSEAVPAATHYHTQAWPTLIRGKYRVILLVKVFKEITVL